MTKVELLEVIENMPDECEVKYWINGELVIVGGAECDGFSIYLNVVDMNSINSINLEKWETFDEQMKALFMKNQHLGESNITIADYMQAQLDLGIIEIGDFSDDEN